MNLPVPLGTAALLEAPPQWGAVDFISDLHLSPALPLTTQAWSDYLLGTRADAVLILGDLFDVWPGDDVVQREFERDCIEVLTQAAQRRFVGFMVGNRDFLLTPALLQRCAVHSLADPTLLRFGAHQLLLTHGDALCLSDVAYQQFRAWSRDRGNQLQFLQRPLAERLQFTAGIRHASEAGRAQAPPPGGWPDIDAPAAVGCLRAAGTTRMVHGHTHRPGDSALAPGFDRIVLSDWDFDAPGERRGEVLRLSVSGHERLAPVAACA